MPNLICLFLQYDQQKYPDSFSNFKNQVDRLFPGDKKFLIIDNLKTDQPLTQINESTWQVGGDNQDFEFSGWQKGLQVINQNNWQYDFVLFADDAWLAPGWNLITQAKKSDILRAMAKNQVYGHVNTDKISAELMGSNVSNWMCTNCFFVPKIILDKLENIVSINDDQLKKIMPEQFPDNLDQIFLSKAPLNQNLQKFIINWLTQKWHSKDQINPDNWIFTRQKVKAILNERMLTARIRQLGFSIRPHKIFDARRIIYDLFFH